MSIHDNKFLKYFTGHTAKVVSLSLSPVDDTIISSSLDKTVRGDFVLVGRDGNPILENQSIMDCGFLIMIFLI